LIKKEKEEYFFTKPNYRIVLQKNDNGYCTVTVPVKKGCSVQKYGISPDCVGIVIGLLDCFAVIYPVSNLPSGVAVAALPEVAVWRALSSFFHITVPPAGTVTGSGS
jgi:hypothetical protein